MYIVDGKEMSSLDEVMDKIQLKNYNSMTLVTAADTTIQMSNLNHREVKSTIGRMIPGDRMVIQGLEVSLKV